MYLIEIETLQLKDFIGRQIPPYAILSHRWGTGELTFKDVLKNRVDKSSRGYRKMLGACQAAKSYKVEYVWIDTCCIDKKSSAELSEAINSMFSWYKDAEVCLTYLEDVNSLEQQDLEESFKNSKWFTRAWTLQEPLAPRALDFYDCQWIEIGSREDAAKLIQTVTNIPDSALDPYSRDRSFHNWDIAERMSWASGREATRTEDIAYSLMGLFDVNMPLLYGEGSKAFIRLQEEIIRSSTTDLSILSGGLKHEENKENEENELLARHPNNFRIPLGRRNHMYRDYVSRYLDTPLHLTSIGLSIKVRLFRWRSGRYAVSIRTHKPVDQPRRVLLLLLRYCGGDDAYPISIVEEEVTKDMEYNWLSGLKTLTIPRNPPSLDTMPMRRPTGNGFAILGGSKRFSMSLDPEPANLSYVSRAMAHWERINFAASSGMLCKFNTAMYPGVARFRVDCAGLTLWINAYFDFDSQPCVCISLAPIVLRTLLDLPDHDANLTPNVTDDAPGERSLQKLQDGYCRGHFFLSAPRNISYKMKIPTIPPMWARLEFPRSFDSNGTRYWSLRFNFN